jgi:hypothetical protein
MYRRPFSAVMGAVSEIIEMVLTYDAVQVAAIRARLLSRDDGIVTRVNSSLSVAPLHQRLLLCCVIIRIG